MNPEPSPEPSGPAIVEPTIPPVVVECQRLRAALHAIIAEASTHAERNQVSGVTRRQQGYQVIITLAQTALDPQGLASITVHRGSTGEAYQLSRDEYLGARSMGVLWEFFPDAPAEWPEDRP